MTHAHRADAAADAHAADVPAQPAGPELQHADPALQPALTSLPSLDFDYAQHDAEDPLLPCRFLSTFALFGFSKRRPEDSRYRALSKIRKVLVTLGIDDLTLTDYVRAMHVHAELAERKAKDKPSVPASSSDGDSLDVSEFSDYESEPRCGSIQSPHLQLIHHMMRHADAVYGLLSNTELTKRVIVRRTGVERRNIVYCCAQGRALLPAHYVCVDHRIRGVLVVIRGTMSMGDWVTDLAATQEELSVHGADGVVHGYAHSGVLRSARSIYLATREPVLQSLSQNPGYRLLLTGHSLGAGVAAVLSLIFRDDDCIPSVTAFCHAPPPCLTLELAKETEATTVSVVNGLDVVPRLSVPVLLPYFATARYVADLSPGRKAMIQMGLRRIAVDWDELEREGRQRTEELRAAQSEHPRLYVPGCVLHLVRKDEGRVKRKSSATNVRVNSIEKRQFLSLRRRENGMVRHHDPNDYLANLDAALRSIGSSPLQLERRSLSLHGSAAVSSVDQARHNEAKSLFRRLGADDQKSNLAECFREGWSFT